MGTTNATQSGRNKSKRPLANSGQDRTDGYTAVTQQIVSLLRQGVVPWQRPWSDTGREAPMNVNGRLYRGVNFFLLDMLDFERPVFLTFRQALELGGHVRRGEKGIPVIFWKMAEAIEEEDGEVKTNRVPFMRRYFVFNVSQCEGLTLPARLARQPEPPGFDPIQAAETVWACYPDSPVLRHFGDRAYYSPTTDVITMPPRHAFNTGENYYASLFHEMGHSTGHPRRLDRNLGLKHGPQAYSREELTAELCAAFLCHRAGISGAVIENQASYIAYWQRALLDDHKLFVVAAGRAQRAADLILGVAENETVSAGGLCGGAGRESSPGCTHGGEANAMCA